MPVQELNPAPPETQASALERGAVRIAGLVPGLRGMSPSRRVVRAIRGSSWTLAGYAASQIFKLASTLVLARLLVPEAFGAVALVNVFLSGLEMLSDLGINMDVVQHPRGDDPVFINTAFVIQAVRGVLLWAIATSLAYPFAHFYRQPAVLSLLIVGSLSVLLRGVMSGSMWTLLRHVQLGKYNLLTSGSDFFGLVVSVVWAFISPTAWALVVGRVAATLSLVVVSHCIAQNLPSRAWDRRAAKEILIFGSGIVLGTATYFLSGEAERLVIGRFITLIELGCFSLALSISSAAATGLQQIVQRVFFPLISESLRTDRQAAIKHYQKTRYILAAVSAGLALGFIFGSHAFVSIVLGPKYKDSGWMLQLLGVRGAFDIFILLAVSMLFAVGTSKFAAIGNTAKLIFLGLGLTVAFGHYGFHQAVWVLTIAPLASYVAFLIGLRIHCREVLKTELISFAGFVSITAVAMVAMFFFSRQPAF